MKKTLTAMILCLLLILVCGSALAIESYSVGTKQEALTVSGDMPSSYSADSLYYVEWIENPEVVYAASVDSRVTLSWPAVSGNDMYSIYEKINGSWIYKTVTANCFVSFSASNGTHTYGVSGIWASGGNFYESKYVRTVSIAVLNGSDTPGKKSDVKAIKFSGTTDKTMTVEVTDDTYLHITTDALTWYSGTMGQSLGFILPDTLDGLPYFKTLGKDLYVKASKYLKNDQGILLISTYDYSKTTVDGVSCYRLGDERATLTINLVKSEGSEVSKITLNKTKATLTRTASDKSPTLKLKATIAPKDATNKNVTWKSSDPKVAKVDKNGKVTALKAGTATITCTAKDGSGVKATCKITVKDAKVTKLTLNKAKASLKAGKTLQLEVKKVAPAEAVNRNVKWTTSDKKVATVDKNGKVTAKGSGTCIITCTAQDGSGVTVTCKITVK